MDQPTLQTILLAIIAAEGGYIAYLLSKSGGTVKGGSEPTPERPK